MDRRPWGLLYAASTAPALSQILLEPTFAEGLAPPPLNLLGRPVKMQSFCCAPGS